MNNNIEHKDHKDIKSPCIMIIAIKIQYFSKFSDKSDKLNVKKSIIAGI